MPMLPILPVVAGESLTSYLNRVAKTHADMDVFRFLSFIELSRQAAMAPDGDSLARLSLILGMSTRDLKKMTFMSRGGRMREFCGEEVYSEFANLHQTSYCPACLLEDGEHDSSSAGLRVGRICWQIENVRTCEVHGIGLVRRKNTRHAEKFQLMSAVAPDNNALSVMVEKAPHQRVSDLQVYVMNRLAGKNGPSWLDNQPIDLAARACEMLGVILTAGTHANLKLLTDKEWNDAGQVGYGYTSRGEVGVRQALQLAVDRFATTGLGGGPQAVFGRLYQWLQFNTNKKPNGPIRDVVREFILDKFAIVAGTDLFGELVERQRVHSVFSLAKLTGDHPMTINRAMISSGLMEGELEKTLASNVFDAEAGEALMQRIRTSIPVVKLPAYLNCSRSQAEQLVRAKVIPRQIPDAEDKKGALKQVGVEDADAFLERLLGAASLVDTASDNVMGIARAAEVSRWPVVDIVNGILKGVFRKVELVDKAKKFKGIRVDPVEVREVLSRQNSNGRVELDDAVRIIGLSACGLSSLVKMRKPDGSAYLTEHFMEKSNGVKIRLFDVKELESFNAEYVSLKDIADDHGLAPKAMKSKLGEHGLVPITQKYELGRIWYRRADLPTF